MDTQIPTQADAIAKAKDSCGIVAFKGECEAEGLSRTDLSREALLAARNGLDYVVKIGGCEAKGDMNFLLEAGIDSIVAPMIETAFAMKKYMDMLPSSGFAHRGVTIETITAVENIDGILAAGRKLTEVTIGRSDLTASYGGKDVESERTTEMVKLVARKAKSKGLAVTMGGSISKRTVELLAADEELSGILDFVETRKVVVPAARLARGGALHDIVAVETLLMDLKLSGAERIAVEIKSRQSAIARRV